MDVLERVSDAAQIQRDASPPASVVVPCYNGGRFLDGLTASLARQTLAGIEVIIVNDGSTDPATLSKLAALESQVRVIHQENRGLSATRNVGISAAKAEFVAVLDCDDTFEPPFLEEAVALMKANPHAGVAFSHLRLTGETDGLIERNYNLFDLLFTNTLPSGVMLRKTCWQAVGGYDETMRDGYEDWEFYLRLAHAGYEGIEIAKPYFNYAVTRDGMLFNKSSRVHAALWRTIRRKHADLFKPWTMLKLWWTTRKDGHHVSAFMAITACVLTAVLPDAWYSRIVAARRRRMLLQGHLKAYPA